MLKPQSRQGPSDIAEDRIHPEMPAYVSTEAEFRNAVELGLADIASGRTAAFEDVAHRLRKARTTA